MFSGKTEELMRVLRREKIARRKVRLFKPDIDKRSGPNVVASHSNIEMPATMIKADRPEEILLRIERDVNVVGIDEAQFFGPEIVNVCNQLTHEGIKVYCAGLKQDFKGEPFGSMGNLLTQADYTTLLTAICDVCGLEATTTQRLVDGVPASRNAPQLLIGGKESYQARCKDHYTIPDE
jgi:thymidine kinase